MNKRIDHPFQVPDDFFENFRNEMLDEIDKRPEPNRSKQILMLNLAKYAAIIVFSFLLGRESVLLFNGNNRTMGNKEIYSVEAVYSQVSEDDIADFILENNPDQILK